MKDGEGWLVMVRNSEGWSGMVKDGVSGEGWCQVSKSTKLREFVTITSASLPI